MLFSERLFYRARLAVVLVFLFICTEPVLAAKQKLPIVVSPKGGVFTSNVTLSLTTSAREIRYTVDGSEPGANSPLYTAPLIATNSLLLKARAFSPGSNAGEIVAEAYTLIDTNVIGFTSTLPLVIIDTFGQSIQLATNTPVSLRFINTDTNRPATLTGAIDFQGQAKIKPRGYTSLRNPKKSYAVETVDSAGEPLSVSILGFPKDSDWILYAPYADKTMIRDVLAYELSNRLGHYASRTRFVEVFINDTTNRLARAHYAGVYVLEEKVKVAPSRVAIRKLSPKDKAEPDITGGYLFKKDHLEKAGDISADGPARSKRLTLRGPFPTGPGAFPAAPTGFLPPAPDPVFADALSVVTNTINVTNIVGGTNVVQPALAVAIVKTNTVILTNTVAMTNSIVTTNFLVATNHSIGTNVTVSSKTVVNTNPVVASQSVSGTNIVATTNHVDAHTAVITTTTAVTISATYRTNMIVATNTVALTNVAVVTNVVFTTNSLVATNVSVAPVVMLATNSVLVTNVYIAGGPEPVSPYVERLVATGEGFVTSYTNAFFFVEPKPAKITAAQRAWLTNHLNRFEQALYGPDFRNPTNGYAAFIDVDSFIDHHLFVEATKNIDGFRFSAFFTKDRGGKIKMEPIWDWNLSFGNARGKQGYMAGHWYWPQLNDQQYSWFRRLFEDPDFGQRYIDRWAQWRTNAFNSSNLLARVDELAAFLKEPAARNFERWPILGQVVDPEYLAGKTYDEEIQYLKTWITNRMAWIDAQFPPPPQPSRLAGAPSTNDVLTFSAPAGQVYFTLDGSDPRLPGGATSSAARAIQMPIVVTNSVSIMARTRKDDRWSSAVTSRFVKTSSR